MAEPWQVFARVARLHGFVLQAEASYHTLIDMQSARDDQLTLAEMRSVEREVLARCGVDDFEVVDVIGNGDATQLFSPHDA